MNEANKQYRIIFLKIFKVVSTWQTVHQKTCDLFASLLTLHQSFNTISNPECYGILETLPTTCNLIKSTYISNLEEIIENMKKEM